MGSESPLWEARSATARSYEPAERPSPEVSTPKMLNRRQFLASNAAAAVIAVLPAAKTPLWCSHDDWDVGQQACRRCGTTLKQILMKVCEAAAKHAQNERLEDIRQGPFPRNFVRRNIWCPTQKRFITAVGVDA